MSSRFLRKNKKDDLIDHQESDQDDSSQDEEEEEEQIQLSLKSTTLKSSSFSMLGLDVDDDEVEEEEKDNESEEEEEEKKVVEKQKKPQTNNNNNNKKKQTQQNKPKPTNGKQQQQPSTTTKKKNKNKNKKNTNNDIDELVDMIKDIPLTSTTSTTSTTTTTVDPLKEMLTIEFKNMNPANELKKLFGCKLSDMKEAEKKQNNSYLNYNLSLVKKKNLVFVTPKAEWPPLTNPLSMELDRSEAGGINYYKLKWSENYKRLQEDFLSVLSSHDPMMICELLRYFPYHIDSLLQLSQVCLQTADFQQAGDFVERAVFAFECSFHHNFNPILGNSRFEYKIPENKTGFLSIFRHIQILGRRGCPRTALEFCKMLLSFDYSDPLYIRLIIDYYALKSKQYQYLVDFYNKVEKISKQELKMLPNFSYSVALAQFMVEKNNNSKTNEESSKLLQKALIRFPMLLRPMIQKLKTTLLVMIPTTGKPMNLEENRYFVDSEDQLKPVQHLATLYIERSHQLWQSPAVIEWVKENVKAVIAMVDVKNPIIQQSIDSVLKEYSIIDQSIFDHLFLSEYSDVIQRLPPDVIEMMRRDGFNQIDPPQGVDPRRGIGQGYQIYRRQPQQQQQRRQVQQVQQQQQQPQEPLIQENPGNPLLHFFESLLPWNGVAGGQPQQQAARGFLDDYIDVIYDDEQQQQQQQQQGDDNGDGFEEYNEDDFNRQHAAANNNQQNRRGGRR